MAKIGDVVRCQKCEKVYTVRRGNTGKYCSRSCSAKAVGFRNYSPIHPQVKEHNGRWIVGRKLTRKEVVHHIDKDRSNNMPENLLVLTYKEHNEIHANGKDKK